MKEEIRITGVCEVDGYGFTTVYTDTGRMYVIADNRNWTYTALGETLANGCVLTVDLFSRWKSQTDKVGVFTLYTGGTAWRE